jgi:hypothetical protein
MVLFSRNKKRFAEGCCGSELYDYDIFAEPVALNFKGKQ